MRKIIFATYTAILILMIPVLFVAYLNNTAMATTKKTGKEKVKNEQSISDDETTFIPGLIVAGRG